jgi:hypothetical protein
MLLWKAGVEPSVATMMHNEQMIVPKKYFNKKAEMLMKRHLRSKFQ